MRNKDFTVMLTESDGKVRRWRVQFRLIPGNKDNGLCDWERRIIYIDSRLRNRLKIDHTLLHEGAHVTLGPLAGETWVEKIEDNYINLRKGMDANNYG